MSKTKQVLKVKVTRAFNEYRDYVEKVNEGNKKKKELVEDLKETYKEDKTDQDVKNFSFEIFLVDGFHKKDVEILGTRFVNYMRLYKEVPDAEELDKELEDTYEYLRDKIPSQVFIIDKGKFTEINKGYIEEQKKLFEEQGLFERVQDELEKILK
jgi:hypothetical protein